MSTYRKPRHDYGRDPYNTTGARLMALRVVWSFHGPLGGGRAYRDQRHWDFTPGLSSADKIRNYVWTPKGTGVG